MKNVCALLQSEKPIKWVFYGDSITQGAYNTLGWRDYTQLFAERIRFELRRPDDLILNAAYDGSTTRHLLEAFDWRVRSFEPHVVFLMVGMNDCCLEADGPRVPLEEFRKNLAELVQRIRAINSAIPVLQTACPILNELVPERASMYPIYMQALCEMAEALDVSLIDHRTHWLEELPKRVHRLHAWLSDPYHPNEMGHRVFAETIFRALNIYDANSPTGRLFYA